MGDRRKVVVADRRAVPQHAPVPASVEIPEPMLQLFVESGVLMRLARHQEQPIASGGPAQTYLVRSGTLAVESTTVDRHIIGFWHAGDLLEAEQFSMLPSTSMRAVEACELWRVPQPTTRMLSQQQGDAVRAYLRYCTITLKRLALSNVMLGRLTGPQRLASFLISCAVRLGSFGGNRAELWMPMSRADIADHVGLNPDTLSRLVTQLQRAAVIEAHSRRRLVVRDWESLCRRSPLSAAIIATG